MIGWDNIFTEKICQYYNAPYPKDWYEHQPQTVQQFYGIPIHTDRTIQANKQNITIKGHKEKTCKLVDFTFPMDVNISAKEFETLSKYKNLQIEIDRM